MDQIIIDNLCVFAHHGVFDIEKEKGQNFYINAVLNTDLRESGLHDDLETSTDYGKVCEYMAEFMQDNTFDLIEAVAEKMAEGLLLTFPRIWSVILEIRKPSAPIALPFESVSVKIERGWHDVYLSFGSNMGDKESNIKNALEKLDSFHDCRLQEVSKLYITKPYGEVVQDNFLNGACHLLTLLAPEELLNRLHEIEKEAKRERKVHWGPRTLDLDILLYDKLVYESKNLIIPHVDMENRVFVLEPMEEIASNLRHPISQQTIHQLMEKLRNV